VQKLIELKNSRNEDYLSDTGWRFINLIMITKKDIIDAFSNFKCDSCSFKKECDELYSQMRKHTTSAPTLCNAIHKVYYD